MMGPWMVYVVIVSGLSGLAALACERVAGARGWGSRWAWVAAFVSSALIPLLVWVGLPIGNSAGMDLGVPPVLELPPVVVGASGPSLDPLLLGGWLVASLAVLTFGTVSAARLARMRRTWEPRQVEGQRVLVSEKTGPAVVGVTRPTIVIPRWVIESRTDRALILAHETEHLRAGDGRVLFAAWLMAALAPWNVPYWWMLGRLRLAVEADCDGRVLADRDAHRRSYCELLLTVAQRGSAMGAPVPALAEFPSPLERRIKMITSKVSLTRKKLLVASTLAAVTLFAACFFPSPEAKEAEPESVVEATASELEDALRRQITAMQRGFEAYRDELEETDAEQGGSRGTTAREERGEQRGTRLGDVRDGPVFTPFTRRPHLTNEAEIRAALEREYPPLLREAGVGGQVIVYFLIDETGDVVNTRVRESSGHRALDEAALRVANVFDFTPALNRDQAVPVWISIPITFQLR